MGHMACKMYDSGTVMRLRTLRSWQERLRGLLGTDDNADGVVLCGCSSIHTWGMRYPLDVAFVTRDGEVLKSCRRVPPKRFVRALGARYVFERPASSLPWPSAGSWVSIAEVDSAPCGQLAS